MTIDVYSWPTPNGHKVHIALEELGLPYQVHPIHIGRGDQFTPDFLRISPNNRIPAVVDPDGPGGEPIALFESGAILLYLAEKTGRLLAKDGADRFKQMQWLMWQMGGLGPMLGQAHHFRQYAPEKVEYGITRYTNEANRLYGVLERHFASAEYGAHERFIVGDTLSVADIAVWPWMRYPDRQGVTLTDYPRVKRWFEHVAEIPSVQRGIQVLAENTRVGDMTDEEREVLFGKTQFKR